MRGWQVALVVEPSRAPSPSVKRQSSGDVNNVPNWFSLVSDRRLIS